MNKRGFTLLELLAVIILLGIVALITVAAVVKIIGESKVKAFKKSVYSAMESYRNKESAEQFYDLGELEVTTLPLDNNPFLSGTVKRNDNNEVMVVNLTNGVYCANGTKINLTVTDGNCH